MRVRYDRVLLPLISIVRFGCCQRTTARKAPAISTRKYSCQKLATHGSNSWSTFCEPDLVCVLGRSKTARNRQGSILSIKLLKSWSTLASPTPPPMRSCRALPCNSPLATPERYPGRPVIPVPEHLYFSSIFSLFRAGGPKSYADRETLPNPSKTSFSPKEVIFWFCPVPAETPIFVVFSGFLQNL